MQNIGYFAKPVFFNRDEGALHKDIIEKARLLTFISETPPLYWQECEAIYKIGHLINNNLVFTINGKEVTITLDDVSKRYNIPNSSDLVSNIWSKNINYSPEFLELTENTLYKKKQA